jgi:acyl carrier protein
MTTRPMSELRDLVLEVLVEVAPDADVGALEPDLNFRDQIEMDSIDFLNLILELENRLGITIPESDYPKLSNLSGCLDYLAESVMTKNGSE